MVKTMDFTNLFFGPTSDADLHQLFTLDLDEQGFVVGLTTALTKAGSLELSMIGIRRVFQFGVSIIDGIDLGASNFAGEEVDYSGRIPEADVTQQSVAASHSPSPENDGDDITSFSNTVEELDTTSAAEKLQKPEGDVDESQDLSQRTSTVIKTDFSVTESINTQNSGKEKFLFHLDGVSPPPKVDVGDSGDAYHLIGMVSRILKLWFQGIRKASDDLEIDFTAKLFGLPGVENSLSQRELFKLLQASKIIIERSATEYSAAYIETLKAIIIVMHEALFTIFGAMEIESSNQSSNKFHIMKSLVHAFFQANLSRPLNELLKMTSVSNSLENPSDKKTGEAFDLRLSYDTLMRLYTIYFTLANCPVNLLLVDKMSLSLDITTLSKISANVYSNAIIAEDFELSETQYQITSRILPLLTANFNYYYQLHSDLLNTEYRYTNVFEWIAGNRVTSSLYMSIDDIGSISSYPEHSRIADKYNPFLYETERFEYGRKIRNVGNLTDTEYAVRSPTYLVILLMMYQLMQNPSFVAYLTQESEEKSALLDIWLSVSSYVHHYQYKSRVNVFGSRISLLILLKLTSNETGTLSALRDYKINENTWRLCRHRPPPIPRWGDAEHRSALMYIVDIVQIDLRFNLNKKLDFDNCKTALCVLYQILLFSEKEPFEELRSYCWSELFKTLLHFIKFVYKYHNEEDTKYVVEEVFSVFEIVLGPSLGGIVELSSDNWIFGKHIVKTFNYDLYYTILENYDSLLKIFDKFIIKRDNFQRVTDCFARLGESFSTIAAHNTDPSEVKDELNDLLLSTHNSSKLTLVDLDKFNHAETFKLLNKKQGFIDFQKQTELIEIFGLLYSNNWTR